MTLANVLLPMPIALPLLGAGAAVLWKERPWVRRLLSTSILGVVIACAVFLLIHTDRTEHVAMRVGGWGARLGIMLVVDRLSALLLTVSAVVLLVVLCYAIGQRASTHLPPEGSVFHPVYLVLAAGVNLAFMSGDLFNLFVAFEVMLSASYILITLPPEAPAVRAGMTYVVTSVTSSILFLTTIAIFYAATGTVNLALLSQRLEQLPDGLATTLGLLLFAVFGIKAAIVPMHFWLPDSYPTALSAVTAIFAALLTKVAVYALIRTQTLLFLPDSESGPMLALAFATMVVGALCALRQDNLNRVLSFLLVGHIGYLVFGLAMLSVDALRATIMYLVHHILVQAALFCVSGLVRNDAGDVSLRRCHGLMHTSPAVGTCFLISALSLSGIPPLSGFVAKLALLQASVGTGQPSTYVLLATMLATSLLTLAAMTRVWVRMFWGNPVRPAARPNAGERSGPGRGVMLSATGGLVVGGLLLAVFAGPLSEFADRSARNLIDRTTHPNAVTEGSP